MTISQLWEQAKWPDCTSGCLYVVVMDVTNKTQLETFGSDVGRHIFHGALPFSE